MPCPRSEDREDFELRGDEGFRSRRGDGPPSRIRSRSPRRGQRG